MSLTIHRFQNNKVFREAHDHFVVSLSPKDRDLYSRCNSAQELLTEVQKFEAVSRNRLRGRGLIAKIKSFSDRLEPYFDAIGIIVQARPEYAAFVWGTVRMVLQVNFTCLVWIVITVYIQKIAHMTPASQQFYIFLRETCFYARRACSTVSAV